MKLIPYYKKTTGLNVEVDSVRHQYDTENGLTDLAYCINIDIDKSGRISRRKGFTRKLAGDFHSVFNVNDQYLLGVSGDALVVIDGSFTKTNLRVVTVGATMSFCEVAGIVYYGNGIETGKVVNRLSYSWVKGSYVGPDTDRVFSSPPVGHLIAFYSSRVFVGKDGDLWYSEPFNYSAFDMARNFVSFGSRLRMVAPVDGGVYVSNESKVYFLAGKNIKEASMNEVFPYPAIEGSFVVFNGGKVSNELRGNVVMFLTTDGVCLGTGDGVVINITENKTYIPDGVKGSAVLRSDNILFLMNE